MGDYSLGDATPAKTKTIIIAQLISAASKQFETTNAFLAAGLEEFEEKIEALGQQEEEENKSETWISNLVKEYAKVNSVNTQNGSEELIIRNGY